MSCGNNAISSLDVSKNTALSWLNCYNNKLTQLNLANGNNANMSVDVSKNPSLTCIQIDKGFTPTISWLKDTTASYSDNCNYPTLSTQENKVVEFLQILNPVKERLVINTTAKIEKVEIYNAVGQLVKVLQNGNTQVQDLAKGIYIAKITTNSGVVTQKIVKE
ncbi:MAG: T9SS type A sorting domain-containing protein [Bergeyella zoohelcum]|nr:T9SS type A sorting domain-containing protein [Bergeyella zoohelcum]